MYNSDITLQLILHKLREDLLKYRKCFSGAQLVNWVMKNPDLVKSLGMILLAFYSRKPLTTFVCKTLYYCPKQLKTNFERKKMLQNCYL